MDDKSKAKGQRTQRKEPVSLSLGQQQARKPEVTATYTYDSSTWEGEARSGWVI